MMATEESVNLHARRQGFKLLRQRGNMSYSLRLIRDASLVLRVLPNGRFGFAHLRCGRNREASWVPLSSIALLLNDQELIGRRWICSVDALDPRTAMNSEIRQIQRMGHK